jgi:hypothetical protein
MSDGARKEGSKSVEPTAALGNPGMYRDTCEGNAGLKEAAADKTTSDGGSNLETLRQGSMPKPEAVEEVKFDGSARSAAFAMWERHSKGDA